MVQGTSMGDISVSIHCRWQSQFIKLFENDFSFFHLIADFRQSNVIDISLDTLNSEKSTTSSSPCIAQLKWQWKYFKRTADSKSLKYKLFLLELSNTGWTKNMLNHLKLKHNLEASDLLDTLQNYWHLLALLILLY